MSDDELLQPIGESTICALDLMKIGEALLSWAAMVERLGHASPASTLDYAGALTTGAAGFVRDFVAWTSYRGADLSPGCEERVRSFVRSVGWESVLADRARELLSAALADTT